MFSAPLLEGIWRTDGNEHFVLSLKSGHESRVHEHLAPLVGQMVQVASHHVPSPPTPMDPSLWVNIKASGKLSLDADTGIYTVLAFDGSKTELDFSVFHGHCARFLGVTTQMAEQMRDTVTASGLADMVEGLTKEAGKLQELLENLTPGEK